METDMTDILVAGTGPAGLVAALGLANAGFTVTLLGPVPSGADTRTTALMLPALTLLRQLGLERSLQEAGAPLRVMRIIDATRRLIRSPAISFHAAEIGEDAFGWNIPNNSLNTALQATVHEHPAINWTPALIKGWELTAQEVVARLDDGTSRSAALAVAADGRNSLAREAAGIRVSRRSLPQAALVLNFGHGREHGFTSSEFHTETGPCTQVPLPGRRSSLVWVVTPRQAEELAYLDEEALATRVEARLGSFLGRVTVEAGRQIYPLSRVLPERFAHARVMLVGEAAHVFPPIGAQGLNLGIRDVAALVRVTAGFRHDPGQQGALRAYDAARRPDIYARTSAVSLLNASLLSDLLPAQLARHAGMGALGRFSPLRAFFMREGMEPGSGLRAVTSTLREKIRR